MNAIEVCLSLDEITLAGLSSYSRKRITNPTCLPMERDQLLMEQRSSQRHHIMWFPSGRNYVLFLSIVNYTFNWGQ